MRLIDADALGGTIEAIENIVVGMESNVLHRMRNMVNAMPTVDAEPVRNGSWVYDPDGMDFNLGAWVCSECKAKNNNLGGLQGINPYRLVGSRYCPNCGAKMDGEGNG